MTKEEIEIGDLVELQSGNIYRVQKITKETVNYYWDEDAVAENEGELVIDIIICDDSYYSYVMLLTDYVSKITKIYRKDDKGNYMLIWRKENE